MKGQSPTGERQRPGSETDSKTAEQFGEEKKQTKPNMKSKRGRKLTKKKDVTQVVKGEL